MINLDQLDESTLTKFNSWIAGSGKKVLPYLFTAFFAVLVTFFRWSAVDSASYFIVGSAARRSYYAVIDLHYVDVVATERLREEAKDGILGVLVKGHLRTDIGFDDECEILLNTPLEDTVLPQELREILDAMQLDRREQIIATVRSIHEDLQRNMNLSTEQKDDFIWQQINLMEPEPSSANTIYQILTGLSEGDRKIDAPLTNRLKDIVAEEIDEQEHIFRSGDLIISRGNIITPHIAQILRQQGYPEGEFPWGFMLFSVLVALVSTLWIRKIMSHSYMLSSYHGDLNFPICMLILSWFSQVGVIYFEANGLGVFPIIAIIYLTISDFGALGLILAIIFSSSAIASGGDTLAFVINTIPSCLGAVVGIWLFKKNYSRSAVWLHVLSLGVTMLVASLLLQCALCGQLSTKKLITMIIACLLLSSSVAAAMPLLEIIFSIVSPLKLVELTQPSHPLLKRMQIEVPATYHHSQMVGNLAEAAAEAINLNPILLRAGAYYHDIGKLKRPQLFIENQSSAYNEHDDISPAMSALVILSHVKDGLETAEEYHLPPQIKTFIAEHHGTTCLSYFYKKAQQSGLNVDQSQFTYPGPRPQSKETGILMLADSTEAAARGQSNNLKRYQDLTRLVDSVFQSKIDAGQLDDVPFTFKDLTNIKAALVKTLRSMYHTRDIKPLKKSTTV